MSLVYRISINTRKGASDVGMDADNNIDSNTDTPTDDTLRMEPSGDTQVRMGDPTYMCINVHISIYSIKLQSIK